MSSVWCPMCDVKHWLTCLHSRPGTCSHTALCRSERSVVSEGSEDIVSTQLRSFKNCWLLRLVRNPTWFLWSEPRLLLTVRDLQWHVHSPAQLLSNLLTNKLTITSRMCPAQPRSWENFQTPDNYQTQVFWWHSFILLAVFSPHLDVTCDVDLAIVRELEGAQDGVEQQCPLRPLPGLLPVSNELVLAVRSN